MKTKLKKFNNNYQKNSKKIKKKMDFKVVELNLKKQKRKAQKQERANQMKEREERK